MCEGVNMEDKICSICDKQFKGYGNNAYLVNDGICCNECNHLIVLSMRFNLKYRGGYKND